MFLAQILKLVLVELHAARNRRVNIRAVHFHRQVAVKMEFTVVQTVLLVILNKGCVEKTLK